MEGAVILIIIILLLLFLAPIIIASNTRGRIDALSRQIDRMEEKIDEALSQRNVKPPVEEIPDPSPTTFHRSNNYEVNHEPPPLIVDEMEVVFEYKKLGAEPFQMEEVLASIREDVSQLKEQELEEAFDDAPRDPLIIENKGSWWEQFNANNPDLEKFIGENLISKIGIAVLVLGIAFFVKYAIDKNWINEYARVGIGILAGGVVLTFAHLLRAKFKAFSSVLVSGAIAIFYFTITIGFQEYHIFSQAIAFAIVIAITAFSVFVSIAYNRQELAVLSLIGGFAAPFMVSTGEGNYKVLFTYLLILDLGMLVLSAIKNWKLIYYFSYAFTILIFGAWFFDKVDEASNLYGGAILFASLFYLTFFLMGIFLNIKKQRAFNPTDISMLLAINALFCALGLHVFSHFHPELKGSFVIALATFNFCNAWFLYRKFNADKTLVYLLIGLTLTYATLAAPVQLHGNYITLFWAAETTLLMWLGQRSNFKIFRFSSILVFLLMCVSLAIDWQQIYGATGDIPLTVLWNKGFITSLVCLASMVLQSQLLRNETLELHFADFTFNAKIYRNLLVVVAFIIGYAAGFLELNCQVHNRLTYNVLMDCVLWSYHLLFSAAVVFLILKPHVKPRPYLALVIAVVNSFLLFFNFSGLPFALLNNYFNEGTPFQNGFLFHYISLLAYVLQIVLVIKFLYNSGNELATYLRYSYWFVSLIGICVLSAELILHLAIFNFNPPNLFNGIEELSITQAYNNFQVQVWKIGFPVLWGCIAFVLLTLGIRKQIRELRIIALLLLAVTLVKLFVYDIKDVSEAGKISAFILLGILLLIMSFMYQKIKAIILDDEK